MAYLKVTRAEDNGWKVTRIHEGVNDGTWMAKNWDEMKAIIERESLELGPKTRVNVDPVFQKKFGHTPEFDLKEVSTQEFWMWNGSIHNHRPNQGGPKRQPRRIKPVTANLVHADSFGRLWDFTFEWRGHYNRERTSVRMVNVWNSTPEPDGSIQMHSIRVPRSVRSAHEAVAWTFNLLPNQYQPQKET